jgi:hypothetical protein
MVGEIVGGKRSFEYESAAPKMIGAARYAA